MKHTASNTIRIFGALFGLFFVAISAGPYSAEAADTSATFTVE